MKEFGLLKRRNFTKGAPEPTSTEKKSHYGTIRMPITTNFLCEICKERNYFYKRQKHKKNEKFSREKKSRKKQVNW